MGKGYNNALKAYIPLVDFIAGIVGPNCEVVLHDCSNVDESIIAIKNNHISGRKVGGPLTDLGLKLLKEGSYKKKNFLLNYPGKSSDGRKLRSSTYFIKDEKNELIGMLCINIDLTDALAAQKFINVFIKTDGDNNNFRESAGTEPFLGIPENLSCSIDEIVYATIDNTISGLAIPPERLSPDEKTAVVQQLNEKGVFLLKGAVASVAKILKVSENTVYRYLNK
ncbi:YheO-like domain-containing protein [Tepidanaerobacter acetatoxydans Re1]|uniref:YheO-like domain-containing protein n=1 Tax=Tepidanaerobacter acetatoxydans (strain DSM 21804 / JCM 16047 / Re1) TaxID=1209989 RepID=F4LSA6_TEPAE|nr:PAS domain-containing protein [Tepidanaerobacter acetatoxydans]AEE90369.1 YheO-like domain-containing protein [Tepidanaerobacter acetatoxydans Re1]CDI40314.1 YheO-like domain-containing protein [Tepidanaerobacter acetatoxydans Re1]